MVVHALVGHAKAVRAQVAVKDKPVALVADVPI